MDVIIIILATIAYIWVIFPICYSQSITFCANNTVDLLYAENDTVKYISSINYPGDYTDTDGGDCKIQIKTRYDQMNVKVTIVGFIKRNSGKTLKFYNGENDHASILDGTDSIQVNKGYTSSGRNIYITHWSFGNTNDAFNISYKAVDEDEEKDEGSNLSWIAGPIVGGLVVLYFGYHIINNKLKQRQQRIEREEIAPLTIINEKDVVTIKDSNNTAKAKEIKIGTNVVPEPDYIPINIPPPYQISEAIYGRRNVTVDYIPPSTPPPSYSHVTQQHGFTDNFNSSLPGYTPALPNVATESPPLPVRTAQFSSSATLEFPEYIPQTETKTAVL